MAEEEKGKPEEDDKCTHPLMCADEWSDPKGATVIAEYHKDEGAEDDERIEEDLDAFENYWHKKQGINFQGEYHKEGAPYMESPSGWDGHRRRSLTGESATAAVGSDQVAAPPEPYEVMVKHEEVLPLVSEIPAAEAMGERKDIDSEAKRKSPRKEKEKVEPVKLSEVIDLNTLEVASYWIFRVAFGKELHVPIKKEGLADMDVHVHNKDVIVNTNQLYFAFPELVVWHITYTHKGRPILEIGRGVKKGMKVHRINAFRLLREVWMGSKRAEKELKMAGLKDRVALEKVQSKQTKSGKELEEKGDIT
jgi:hypothetical protein